MNFFERAIATISPETALKRMKARHKLEVINDYANHGASTRKKSLAGWQTSSASAIEDIEQNVELLRERSRDLYEGAPIATGAIKTKRTNVVGAGLKLNARIDYQTLGITQQRADELETQIEREFALWADSINCDAQKMNDFYDLQRLAYLSFLISGDCFITLPVRKTKGMPYDLRVQIIEADRVCNPERLETLNAKIINGVEIDGNGEVVAYHIAKHHPHSSKVELNQWSRVPKFGAKTGRINVIHLMEAERPEQRRGIPLLAPVIESLKQLTRYTEAELIAAVVSGMFTVFIKTPFPEQPGNFGLNQSEEIDDEENIVEMAPGSIQYLDEGEEAQISNPGRPNTAFDGFVTSMCRQIGVALEIPYEVLLKHFTSSYSASRAALLEAWKTFRNSREWLIKRMCMPIYEEFLSEAVAKGRIDLPGFFSDPIIKKAYCGAEWNGPTQGQIDPKKEVEAAILRVEHGFSTHTKETTELTGGNWFNNISLLELEERTKKAAKGGDENENRD